MGEGVTCARNTLHDGMTHVKKLITGTISFGAASALLLGVGGTLAYWNRAELLPDSEAIAGTLEVRPVGEPTFSRAAGTLYPEWEPADVETFRMVPDSSFRMTSVFEIEAEGGDFDIQVHVYGTVANLIENPTPADTAYFVSVGSNWYASVDGREVDLWPIDRTHIIKHRGEAKKTYRVVQWTEFPMQSFILAGWEQEHNEHMRGRAMAESPIINVVQLPPSD